jgi:hypothetical protein
MSVDDKLHEAFAEETWNVDTDAALRRVHTRAARARTRRGMVLAGVAAAAVVVAFATVGKGVGNQGAPGPSDPGPTQATESPSSPPRSTAGTPIDGIWQLGPVSAAQIRATLREAGQQRWYRKVMREFPPTPVTYRMTIRNGRVDLGLVGADGRHSSDDQEYITTVGRQAVLEPVAAVGVNRYRWDLVDGRLRLTFVSTSEGHPDVYPGEAFQRALYTVGDWSRAGPAR